MLDVQGTSLTYERVVKTPVKPIKNVRTLDNLGVLLRGYRLRNKLTQAAIARVLEVHPTTYKRWERGFVPSIVYANRISKMLRKEARSISCVKKTCETSRRNYFRSIESACGNVDKSENLQDVDNKEEKAC